MDTNNAPPTAPPASCQAPTGAEMPEALLHRQIQAAARTLAECMDYPWDEMPETGKRNMRANAVKVIHAALSAAAPAVAPADQRVYHFEQRSKFGPWIEVEQPTAQSVEFVMRVAPSASQPAATRHVTTNEDIALRNAARRGAVLVARGTPSQQGETAGAVYAELTDDQIAATAGRLSGMSDTRPLGQQWDMVYELVRKVIRERFASPAARAGAQAVHEDADTRARRLIGEVVEADAIASTICKEVAELPDRDSPTDWPQAMLVTSEELLPHREALIAAAPDAAAASGAPVAAAPMSARQAIAELRAKADECLNLNSTCVGVFAGLGGAAALRDIADTIEESFAAPASPTTVQAVAPRQIGAIYRDPKGRAYANLQTDFDANGERWKPGTPFYAASGGEAQAEGDARLAQALHAAVSAIYFDDGSKFKGALGRVVHAIDPALAGELLCHPKAAFDKSAAREAAAMAAKSQKGAA